MPRFGVHESTATLVSSVDDDAPHVVDDDERRNQSRFVAILFRQAVSIEAPSLDALLLNHLERVTATTERHSRRSQRR